ncbi:non-receptor serine/threonine protein kinase [Lithospermum erythrorhizon]|uniref:Non-receptor serine/threonine protein kinase n=1 Tax=Lithospermum erythrorhizon TaxID=34254 RepID=A0AAV3RLT9_LITER
MSESGRGGGRFVVGDYVVGRQIGQGSFSTVWHARHRAHGTEVAIKEIVMTRLNNKLQESLKSEIFILKKVDHPNIIRLHDMIEEYGKMYIILEYCRGGDLSMYLQKRQGRIPEATAKHFMQHLASGLKILRDNNVIHRDLKPQNLLLSRNDDSATLKIADFGFARSLHPRGLAETLCGSPLYMAPEIMQLQKYDAKADLWSVGAILFQLVTGRTPYTGNNQLQLLQNIVRSNDLQFPQDSKDLSPDCINLCRKLLRRNPVERLTFEEFFSHPFLSQKQADDGLRNRGSPRVTDGFPISERIPVTNSQDSTQEDLPFSLDDDCGGPDGSLFKRSSHKITIGFPLEAKDHKKENLSMPSKTDIMLKCSNDTRYPEADGYCLGSRRLSEGKLKESHTLTDHRPINSRLREMDLMELIDQDYVMVSGPLMDSSSSASASKSNSFIAKSERSPVRSANITSTLSSPVPVVRVAMNKESSDGNLECHGFVPRTAQGSLNVFDTLEHPSADCMTRIKSLKSCACAISELVKLKTEEKRHLEALSIQLVILALWKQALHICHTQLASAVEGSSTRVSPGTQEPPESFNIQEPSDTCSEIERAFLLEVGNAEELVQAIEPAIVWNFLWDLWSHSFKCFYIFCERRRSAFSVCQFLLLPIISLCA